MAGIGFELRRLTARDNLIGLLQGYGYAAAATSGPWLFTILSLSAVFYLGMPSTPAQDLASFRVLVAYNFALSFILSGPLAMVTTRHLADCIHARDVKEAPAFMLGAMLATYGASLPLIAPLYLLCFKLEPTVRLSAILNFSLLSGIWIVSVFLTALKNYRAIMLSFAAGMSLAVICAALLAPTFGISGMLTGFNAGLALILFALIARIFAEYPTRASRPFQFLTALRGYWDLALAALFLNAAIWVDKWIMWFAPEREILHSGLISFPDYNAAMFLAYLSIAPSMAAFTLSIETRFFEEYVRFYGDIQRHVPYSVIEHNHRELTQSFLDGARNFLVLQGSVTATAILIAPRILDWLSINFRQLGIFRLGLLGAFFHAGFLFLSAMLSYFDQRRRQLELGLVFFTCNGVFTFVALRLGLPYYGYGYFLSTLVAFTCAFVAMVRLLSRLPYEAFIRSNTAIQK